MQAIIDFLSRRYVLLLFLFLEFVAFSLLIQNSKYQRSTFFNSTGFVIGNIYQTIDDWKSYLSLKKENEFLRNELENLNYVHHTDSQELVILPFDAVGDSTKKISHYVAKVINSTTNYQNNFLTLDKGSLHGIEKNMAVISSRGVVGIVKEVSTNYSKVISILSVGVRFNAKLERSNYSAAVQWNNKDHLHSEMVDLPSFVDIQKGDLVVTNSYSALFPEGIPIGEVESFDLIPGEKMYTVDLKLSNDLRQLDYVMVLKVENVEERRQLEEIEN